MLISAMVVTLKSWTSHCSWAYVSIKYKLRAVLATDFTWAY